ncbi:stage II sporulation protein R [Pontibacillus chungwhensis]|uniref:stage II sporulation protein R n=1 Tax=Pontibacillus chungwhensis TaxID=265426 RepID=UPI000A705D34|nr:stage II sporulation protein R [Pontibacillus chungwhensis]
MNMLKKVNVKKAIGVVLLVVLGAVLFPYTLEGYNEAPDRGTDIQVIPDQAIRLRILANSDGDKDQAIKRKVRDAVNAEITVWVEELTSIEAARELIQSRLGELEEIVDNVLKEEGVKQTYTVDYGKQVKFPAKLYGTYLYPAGEYEAILISLGKGDGANWWCVLFPPLCFLDFNNGTSVAAETTDQPEQSQQPAQAEESSDTGEIEENEVESDAEAEREEVEVKFFLTEWFNFL